MVFNEIQITKNVFFADLKLLIFLVENLKFLLRRYYSFIVEKNSHMSRLVQFGVFIFFSANFQVIAYNL